MAENLDSRVFEKIPLTALSKETYYKLSHLLNAYKIFRTADGYERDWRGVATLAMLHDFNLNTIACNSDNQIRTVLQLWCRQNPVTATFDRLFNILKLIDRWDVSDDIYENLISDSKLYLAKQQGSQCNNNTTNLYQAVDSKNDITNNLHSDVLTQDDVILMQNGQTLQMYDAFVLFDAANVNYVEELINKLENNPEYNFKLCIKDRDLLAGVSFEHLALIQLIEERCKHLIVIITKEFLNSPANKFLVDYTQALQIEHKTRKIIPLLYDSDVEIPRNLRIYTHLRYNTNTSSLFNFWSKLASSICNITPIITKKEIIKPIVANETQSIILPVSEISTKNQNNVKKYDDHSSNHGIDNILLKHDELLLNNETIRDNESHLESLDSNISNELPKQINQVSSYCKGKKKFMKNLKKVFNRNRVADQNLV